MLIECMLKRDEPIIVPMSNDVYEFRPDEHGRRVCEVQVQSHIDCFLAVENLYREVKDSDAPAPTEPEDDELNIVDIKGIGIALVGKLKAIGVTTVEQIAAWTDADVEATEEKIGGFKGRIMREHWVEQAQALVLARGGPASPPSETPPPPGSPPEQTVPMVPGPAIPESFAKFDHDNDGHPGGSLPKPR